MKKLKHIAKDLRFLKALFSPFKPFGLRLYCGKIAIGTPYFFPRRWVKATPKLAHEATLEYIQKEERYNEMNPKYARKIKPYEEIYKEKLRYNYAVPRKFGFDFVRLGWKTKWSDTDYRFEWAPLLSFVFFKWQIAIIAAAPERSRYWECWLYYDRNTDKTKSRRERIIQCRREFPQTWSHYEGDSKITIDYYNKILKPKYLG